jgi:SAM-dependent methyltransferase
MFGTREPFEYFDCAACETLQIVNPLDDGELARHYPEDYYSYNLPNQPRILEWLTSQYDRSELRLGGRFAGAPAAVLPAGIRVVVGGAIRVIGQLSIPRDARILDVGCGGGALLERLARAGYTNLFGADPLLPAEYTTPQGVSLMKRYLSDVAGEFDLIMFNHSLEHMPDPVATLKETREKLANGGICLVRVPTTSSEAWTTYQADWFQIDAPRHIAIPSRKGMALAADSVGLRVEQTFDDSNLAQFVSSEAYGRDVAMSELKSIPNLISMFGVKRMWDWARRSTRLNQQNRGDQTGFVLRAKD